MHPLPPSCHLFIITPGADGWRTPSTAKLAIHQLVRSREISEMDPRKRPAVMVLLLRVVAFSWSGSIQAVRQKSSSLPN